MSRDAREYLGAFKFDHLVVLCSKPRRCKTRRCDAWPAGAQAPGAQVWGPSLFATLLEQAPRCLLLVDGHLASA